MKRGEISTVSGGGYAGKPRPAVVAQDERFDATLSATICALTTDETEAPLFRLVVQPSERDGLRVVSRLIVNQLTTLPKERLGERIGRLDDEDMVRLNSAILVFLGLT